eukprot:gene7906-10731_t
MIKSYNSSTNRSGSALSEATKELSKPFTGTIECYTNITSELFRTGLILALTYICEKHWIFDHSTKSYSRDLFIFVLILFFAYAFYTIKPCHDLTLLGREQTEEWKGWMQFIFLLYHYFHAEEVYNSVRVMITCYVWMTGFGNFSFFYIKQDFGWLRVMQMMWRLNFSVLLLMWTHGNTWILYYICPMHTFYFLMVYVTMYVYSSINHSKYGIRFKLLIVGIIIYIIWDINNGIFDFIFGWLGTDSVIGAKNGSVWEYYFRTSLDHWSSFLGMIFALNFPLAEQFFVKAKGYPLILAAILIGSLFCWWMTNFYFLEKLAYNLTNSYYAIIPLIAYIFFRNITPYVRSGVSMSLHDLGKTTLETYLLQHHIWLTSNAKTLLTLTPGHPWINFALTTVLFFVVSKELYRLTMSLRGMIMPDDKNITWNNCIGLTVIMSLLYAVAYVLYSLQASLLEIFLASLGLFLVSLLIIGRFTRNFSDNFLYTTWSRRAVLFTVLVLGSGVIFQLIKNSSNSSTSPVTPSVPIQTEYKSLSGTCLQALSKGTWSKTSCNPTLSSHTSAKTTQNVAFCEMDKWMWEHAVDDKKCNIGLIDSNKARQIFKNKQVYFIGDSTIRHVYHQFIELMEPKYVQNHSYSFKHSDIEYKPVFDRNLTIQFKWAPMISNVTSVVKQVYNRSPCVVVMGVALWDALYIRNLTTYKQELDELSKFMSSSSSKPVNIWISATNIEDNLLSTQDKQLYMNEKIVSTYRQAFNSSEKVKNVFHAVIDTRYVSSLTKGVGSVDGIHYSQDVYHVIAQMISNAYSIISPVRVKRDYNLQATSKKKYTPKSTGSMSSPYHGAIVLLVATIMLFTMDSFFGLGFLSLSLFGRSLDWEEAYRSLHNKILNNKSNNPINTISPIQAVPIHESKDTDALLAESRGENTTHHV